MAGSRCREAASKPLEDRDVSDARPGRAIVARLRSVAVTVKRMNREQFYAKLATLDEAGLKKILWTVYWRGSASVRERLEAELDPVTDTKAATAAAQAVDPEAVRDEVREFVALARAGAYMAGDRRVSPKERSRWRLTFQRLATNARAALAVNPLVGAEALTALVDLADATRDYDCFHSDDPMEAARFVVSDAVALLWGTLRDHYGFTGFAERAAPQLVRWEAAYGWTRRGDGPTAEKETSLADVLARMLRSGDAWVDFAHHYLRALDQVDRGGAGARVAWRSADFERGERARHLSAWHQLLLERLEHSEVDDLLDRLVAHPALGGPELTYLQARLAKQRGDIDKARTLTRK
jgi:hypothetical protein